jgi:hypothetical protein
MAKTKTAAKKEPATPTARMAARTGAVEVAELASEALRQALLALVPLEFNQRRDVVRWVCDHYSIDPTKLPVYYPEGVAR